MENPITAALEISAIGFSLLLLALAAFYALIALMTLAPRRKHANPQVQAAHKDTVEQSVESVLAAAAAAVALARAQAEDARPSGVQPLLHEGQVQAPSAWWVLHHQRNLTHLSIPRRKR